MSKEVHYVASLGNSVGGIWKEHQEKYSKDGFFYVSSPLSTTPIPIYSWLINHAGEISGWNKMRFILMDELVIDSQIYISSSDPASYEGFARKNFLEPLKRKVKLSTDVIVKPDLINLPKFSTPIHLLILALGIDGNYANVMPKTSLETGWHIAHLTEAFRQVHTGKGGGYEGSTFGEYGMSLGPQQVLAADHVIVIASQKKKAELIDKLLSYSSFNPAFPISIIYHPVVSSKVDIYLSAE